MESLLCCSGRTTELKPDRADTDRTDNDNHNYRPKTTEPRHICSALKPQKSLFRHAKKEMTEPNGYIHTFLQGFLYTNRAPKISKYWKTSVGWTIWQLFADIFDRNYWYSRQKISVVRPLRLLSTRLEVQNASTSQMSLEEELFIFYEDRYRLRWHSKLDIQCAPKPTQLQCTRTLNPPKQELIKF